MIQKKRINNDVFVRWGVFTPEGLPVDLTEVTSITIEARPQSSNGRYPMVSEVVDNFVEAYFLAKDQKVVGKYNLYLTYTIDDPNIIGGVATYTIDYCDAFELLPKSCFVDGEDDVDPVNIQGIIASFTYSMLTDEEKNDLASRLSGNSGAQNLSDLLDVTISNLEIDQVLKYDGTKWVNAPSSGESSSNVSWGIPTSQYTPLTVNGVTRNLSLNNHTHSWDTITNRPLTDEQFQDLLEISGLWKLDNDGNLYTERNVYSHGEVSAYNWGESPTPPVGVYNLKDLLDVGIINPQEDNILRFNGSHWVNVPSSNVGTLVEWSSETDNYVNLLVGDSSKSISLHGHKHEIEDINNLQDSLDFKQDSIPLGDISQYYRGDKEWATLNTDTVVESTNLYYTPERVIELTGDLYAQKDHTHAFNSLTGLPNTLDGYGIIDAYNKTEIDNLISSTSGFWVKSVGLEAPTGFTVSNSPIIYEGNIKLSFASGYSLPSNSKQYNWDLAFSDRHTHTNISVLNELTIDDVNNWNSIQEHLNDYDNPHQVFFKQLINKPSTLLGYGITDVYSKTEVDYIISNITPGESTIKNVYGYDSIDQSFSDNTLTDTFNAYTISRLHGRLTVLEQKDINLDTIINWYNNIGRYWLLDANNDALYTNKNVYSTKEVSAYGLGTGGGGGTDYNRLDDWANYDSTKAGWVLSAFLGVDLDTRLTALEQSAGGVTSVGISVPTGLSVSNSPITSSGVIAISLQTGYSIPTTVKQDNWDTAFDNTHTHSNKTVLDGITSALITDWNTAFTNNHTHSNKAQLDLITQSNIDVLAKLSIVNGNLQIDGNAYATGELSAYGLGSGGGSGGAGALYELSDTSVNSRVTGDILIYNGTHWENRPQSSIVPDLTGYALESWVSSNFSPIGHTHDYIPLSQKGSSNGVAELDATGHVPASQLPSYVDDVIEAANLAGFPTTGETGKIYVALDSNLTYRWSGSGYVEISPSLALGETSSTAYRGDRGKIAYDHSQVTGNPHNTTFAQLGSKPTTLSGFGITDAVTSTVFDNHKDNINDEKHLTQAQLTNLINLSNWWKWDVVNQAVYTEENVYSEKEISAYGFGSGGTGPGGSYAEWKPTINNYAELLVEGVTKNVALSGHTHNWSDINNTPDTLLGYGIDNAYTKTQVDNLLSNLSDGTVKSVGLSAPTGFSVSNSPVTGTGVLELSFVTGHRLFTTEEANKLSGIAAGAQVNVPTNLAQGTRTATTVPVTSSTGNTATLQAVTTSLAGVMSAADKTKLDGIDANANNYIHPNDGGGSISTALTGASVISRLVVNTLGHVTATATRNLTKGNIGLGNVDNTSDINKPISTATQNALDLKLDESIFEDLFEKVEISAGVHAIKAKYDFFGVGEVAAYGFGSGGGSGSSGALYDLSDVIIPNRTTGDLLVYNGTHWINQPQSSIIPNLTGYATESWSDNRFALKSHSHIIGDITGLQGALDNKVDNNRVLTDVPLNAKFTDTVPITSVNGKTGTVKLDVEDIESLNKLSVILGDEAGKSITTGDWNVMIGNKSGESNTTGAHITAVGNRAGAANLEESFWTAVGSHAAYKNTTGYGFTAIGVDAGRENISGYGWTAVGAAAGKYNTTGRVWTAIGSQAGENNTTGISWTAIGYDAGKENLTGNAWTAVGSNAGQYALGSFWTAVGLQAGRYNTVDESVSIGFKAAENLANGTSQATSFANSVHIGSRVKVSADGVTNEIAIGHNAIGKGSNTVVIGNDDTTKTYLNGEVHASIAASMITESTTKRFVTDTEKSTWNAKSNLALGTTSSTAYRGDRGATAYNHSQATGNPHGTTKAQVGLGNVDNVKQATKSEFDTHTANSTIHITSTERTNWNTAYTQRHTHGNKTIIDKLTQGNIDVLGKLSIDASGNLKIDTNAYATGELSAYGYGDSGGSSGGIIETVYGYSNLGQTFNNATLTDTFNAYTINQINNRLLSVEGGSATGVTTSGTGDVLASVTKSGNNIAFTKGNQSWTNLTGKPSTFVPSTHTHPFTEITGTATTAQIPNLPTSKITSGVFATARLGTGTPSSANYLRGDGTWVTPPDTTYSIATTSANGLMSATDKVKLNGIATGANNYTHPSSHPATIITQTSSYRFVTDTEKSTWNAKSNLALGATSTTAYRGDRGTIAYNHSQATGNPHGTTIAQITGLQGALDTKATQLDIDTAIDGIEIGGRNLIIQSLLTDNYINTVGVASPSTVADATEFIEVIPETNYIYTNPLPVPDNMYIGFYDENKLFTRRVTVPISERQEYHFKPNVNEYFVRISNSALRRRENSQLEKGNKATDWTPAPEDVQAEINLKANIASPTFTGTVTAPTFSGALSGNASTATTLATARTINGTSFDGSENITTSRWGTARTLTIGSTGKSVNGSGNVSWTLAEIGAAPASHNHSASNITSGTIAAARLPAASTSVAGIVQLSTSTSSTSTTLAATASAVKSAYDLANSKWTYNEATIRAVKVNSAVSADTASSVTWANVTSKPTTATRWPSWSEVTGKPSTFAPSNHEHSLSDIKAGTFRGNTMKFYTTSTNNDMSIRIGDRDGSYGFNWIYRGTATGNDNSLELWGDDSTSGELAVKAIEVKQNGAVHIDNLVSSLSWGQVTGKPSAFTPSTHTHSNITITAGNGLSGGGTLAANRTITLGTPSTLTNATTNSVAASSHTHAITTTTVGAANTIVATDASGGVRGNAIKIGSNWSLELSGTELQIKYGGVLKQRMLSDGSFVAEGEVSALGEGAGGSTGGSYERLDAWTDYAAGKEGWVLSALLGKNLDTRVTNLNNSIPNIQVVSSLPTSPTAGVFYFVKE